jgi:hypothetical protein
MNDKYVRSLPCENLLFPGPSRVPIQSCYDTQGDAEDPYLTRILKGPNSVASYDIQWDAENLF